MAVSADAAAAASAGPEVHYATSQVGSFTSNIDDQEAHARYKNANVSGLQQMSWLQLCLMNRYHVRGEASWGLYASHLNVRHLMRGQTFARDTSPEQKLNTRWEAQPGYHTSDGSWFSVAYFPAVRQNADKSLTTALYGVLYSSFQPSSRGGNGTANAVTRGTVSYRPMQLADNPASTVRVDFGMIHDENAALSVKAALESCWPVDGSFITFFACVDDQQWDSVINDRNNRNPHVWSLSGPSMGVAIMAAVTGAPPVAYTGYIKNLFPNVNTRYDGARVLSSKGNPADNFLTPILKSDNVVENVAQIAAKVALCLKIQMPIVIPYTTFDGQPILETLDKQRLGGRLWNLNYIGQAFSMADAEDGVNYCDQKPIYLVGRTVFEMFGVAAYAAIGYFTNATSQIPSAPRYQPRGPIDVGSADVASSRHEVKLRQAGQSLAKQKARKAEVANLPILERKPALRAKAKAAAEVRAKGAAEKRMAKAQAALNKRLAKLAEGPRPKNAPTVARAKREFVGVKAANKEDKLYGRQRHAVARWELLPPEEKERVRERGRALARQLAIEKAEGAGASPTRAASLAGTATRRTREEMENEK